MKEVKKLIISDEDLNPLINHIIEQTKLINNMEPNLEREIDDRLERTLTVAEREVDDGWSRIRTEIRRLIHHGHKIGNKI